MLTIFGERSGKDCDRLSRRNFFTVGGLTLGGLAFGGLSLPEFFARRAQSAGTANGSTSGAAVDKSVIMICLGGGPSQIDTYDMRPEAPAEYRGEFSPIASNVPGMDLCELMPRQATLADKLAVVRTVQWTQPCHQYDEICTGYPAAARRPGFGAIANRLYAGGTRRLPRFVDLGGDGTSARRESEQPLYVGSAYRSFAPTGPGMADLKLPKEITLERLGDRSRLRTALDSIRRAADGSGEFAAVDQFTRQALDMVTGDAVREAFDLSREPAALTARYGDKQNRFSYLARQYPFEFESFILARRLAEAGVPFISFSVARWDHHCLVRSEGSIFDGYRTLLPLYDMAVAGLVEDLHARGLDKRVAVVVWGEFGRTPRVNKTGGRDHWPSTGCVLFAGGGFKTGRYIGETDSRAEQPKSHPYGPQNVLATLYRHLGIDPSTTLPDHSGRPVYLLDDREPIAELI